MSGEILQTNDNTKLTAEVVTPMKLMEMALQGGNVDQLDKLMALQERFEANEAKKAYVAAMAKFKTEPLDIKKNKRVFYTSQKGTTDYMHADLAEIVEEIGSKLGKHGLSASWRTRQDNGNVCVTCTITHSMGHSEATELCAAPDTSGGKNSIQGIGSTTTYLQRYTLMSITGAAAKELNIGDPDGYIPPEFISEDQVNTLHSMIHEAGVEERAMKWLSSKGVDSLDAIQVANYDSIYQQFKKVCEAKNDSN